jgi:hypothetical protein
MKGMERNKTKKLSESSLPRKTGNKNPWSIMGNAKSAKTQVNSL